MSPSEFSSVKVNVGEKDEFEIHGYRPNRLRFALTLCAILLTGGLLLILLAWKKNIKLSMFHEQCALNEAKKLLLKDSFQQLYEEDVLEEKKTGDLLSYSRYFYNKKVKYIWDDHVMHFVKIRTYDQGMSCDSFHQDARGLDAETVRQRQMHFGKNAIPINVLPILTLVWKEISNPFYLIQAYIVIVWVLQAYYDYSALVILVTLIAVGSTVWQTRKQMRALREKIYVTGKTNIIRGGVEKCIDTRELVPGDVLAINPQETQLLHCDAVLIEGLCSVDESMLTGESYPITKIPLPHQENQYFDYNAQTRHILFCGTTLLQGRPEQNRSRLKAIVIRTGFMTCKGELVRSILYPKPTDFRFYKDLIKCANFFFLIGFGGMIYSAYTWIRNEGTVKEIVLNTLDIVTFVVPPILPAALTATTSFAQRRLRQQGIFCLSSKHIILCGGIDVVCFDKTGTLTENDIDVAGAVPIDVGEFRHPIMEIATLNETHPLLVSMATCHTLIRVGAELSGYSLDKKMFEATGWEFFQGPSGINENYGIETPFIVRPRSLVFDEDVVKSSMEIAILKQYPFESLLKRSTVIVQRRASEYLEVFIKGAPEIIATLCDHVTVPHHFEAVLKHYTMQGFRVLALATKRLSPHLTWSHVQAMSRDELEIHMELIGLLIVQNQLKKQTLPNIQILHEAHFKTVMVTGDNLQTAINVAKECQMIPPMLRIIQVKASVVPSSGSGTQHVQISYVDPLDDPECCGETVKSSVQTVHDGSFCLAMDGMTFQLLRDSDPSLFRKIIHRSKIFARMNPADKQLLIEDYQQLGHQVAMVGDGCNDCGALRTADAGISLSMADASVAAPFTSQAGDISCVPPIICEGRTTLDAAFGTFQFAIGICFIFFIGVLMLYSISTEPSDFQYFVWDFGINLIPFFTIGNASPSYYLHIRRPVRHLWGFIPFFSFFTFQLWQTLILIIGWFYCHSQPWFVPFVFEAGRWPPNASYEETTLFFLMCIGTIVAAFVFAPSQPYTKHPFTNRIFAVWSIYAPILMICVMFITDENFTHWLNLKSPPHYEYTLTLLLLGIVGGIICYAWEKYFIRNWLYQRIWPRLNMYRPARHMHQKIEEELRSIPEWPQLGSHVILSNPNQDVRADDTSSVNSSKTKGWSMSNARQFLNHALANRKLAFSPFRTSKRGGYTINGPNTFTDHHYDTIPMTDMNPSYLPPYKHTATATAAAADDDDGDAATENAAENAAEIRVTIEDLTSHGPISINGNEPPSGTRIDDVDFVQDPVRILAVRQLDTSSSEEIDHVEEELTQDNVLKRYFKRSSSMEIKDETHLHQDLQANVQLIGYRPNPEHLSPSRHRRHLNGNSLPSQ